MSGESKTERRAWIRRIGGTGKSIIALLCLILGSGVLYFAYENFVNVPDVAYAVLPTYELEGQSFGGLVVENTGRATAHDVRINLGDLRTPIEQTSVQSDESWRQESGGSGEETLVLWLDRMTSGSSVTVYLLTEEVPQLDELAVTTEEGPGHVAGGQSMTTLVPPLALGALFGGLIASVVHGAFYWRLKSEMQECQSRANMWKNIADVQTKLRESYRESWENAQRELLEEPRTRKPFTPPPPPKTR